MSFKKIELDQLNFNPFLRIGRDWVLLTGGTSEKFNTMTASWGQLGRLWNKNVFTAYIRPNRYTLEFVEKEDCFTASFFTMDYRKELSFCGSHSGRDVDKVKETGLTPVELDGCMAFEEADMVFVLRKLYTYDMQESGFITDDGFPQAFYSEDPYHKAFISEITTVYVKE